MISSRKAILYAYDQYRTSAGERAERAVWLIKHIAHPLSLQWVEEFLNDPNVISWGLGVLDQLLWTEQVFYDEKVQELLQLSLLNSGGALTGQVAFIEKYIQERNKTNN